MIYPRQLIIEATSRCNLFCEGCYRSQGEVSDVTMSLGVFAHIVDQLTWEPKPLVCPTSHGEPLLDPEFDIKLSYLADHGHRVDFATNGTILREGIFHVLAKYPKMLHRVIVSLDGLYEGTRSIMRHYPAGLIGKPIEFVGHLLSMRRSGSLPDSFDIAVSLVKNGQDTQEVEDFIRHWLTRGVDMVLVRNLLSSEPQVSPTPKSHCHFIDGWIMTVDANGFARLCDRYMPGANTFLGDTRKRSVLELFNEGVGEYRDGFPYGLCRSCPQPYSGNGIHGEVTFKKNGFTCFYSADYFHSIFSMKNVKGGLSWGKPE